MTALYSNENFPLPVVEELRRLGHDVLTIQEVGQSNQGVSDQALLIFAHANGRVLLTLNRKHFVALHNAGEPHSGIIACTYDPDSVGLARRIDTALREQGDVTGKLIRVNRPA